MAIKIIPLDEKIGGLPAFRVIGWSKKLLMKEFEIPVKDAIWEATMESEMVDTLHSYTGSVGVIAHGNFYLINNMSGKDETDGLTLSRVGVVNSLPPEVRAQMVYMSSWRNFQISNSDYEARPRHDFEIEPNIWYECYARDGYVIFVKGAKPVIKEKLMPQQLPGH